MSGREEIESLSVEALASVRRLLGAIAEARASTTDYDPLPHPYADDGRLIDLYEIPQGSGWPRLPSEDALDDFWLVLYLLSTAIYGIDADGDRRILASGVDRKWFEAPRWSNVPHHHKDPDGYQKATFRNLTAAVEAFKIASDLRRISEEGER